MRYPVRYFQPHGERVEGALGKKFAYRGFAGAVDAYLHAPGSPTDSRRKRRVKITIVAAGVEVSEHSA